MKTTGERLFTIFAWASGALLFFSVGCIIVFLIVKGWNALTINLVFGTTRPFDALLLRKEVFEGLFPAIAGTIALVVIAVTLAIPVGLAAGIYLAEYSTGRWKDLFSLFCDILAGVPSIIIGLFGFSAAIFLHRYVSTSIYPSLLISAFSLSFLVLPYLIRTVQIAFENIPHEVRLAALALGASRLQNIFFVLIPRSLSGITSGIILSIGRCAEDTAVIMLTGAVALAGIPKSLLSRFEALPFYIYYISSQYSDPSELGMGYGAAIILVVICVALFTGAFLIKRHLTDRMLYRL